MSEVQQSIVDDSSDNNHQSCFHIQEATTQFDYEEFIFRWKLKVPSIKLSLYNQFESPVFFGGDRSQHSWQLRWDRNHNGYVYVYNVRLILVAFGNNDCFQGDKIQAQARMSLKKSDETELLKVETDKATVSLEDIRPGQVWKTMSVCETDFWDVTKGYIVNDIFTVACRIFVSCAPKKSSVSKLVLASSGESYAFNNDKTSRSVAELTKNALCALDFADVKLVTDTKSFPAHKVVLAAQSPVFSAMFRTKMQEMKENSVEIKDFEAEAVEAMLEFMYTGKIMKFTEKTSYCKAAELLRISDKYEVMELKAQCELFMSLKVEVENAVEMLELASLYSCKTLKAAVLQFIMSKKTNVCETDAFKKLKDPSILMDLFVFK